MKIENTWEIEDKVSGLKIKIVPGKRLDRIHIEYFGEPICKNRDFWFTKDGKFDGTGSGVC